MKNKITLLIAILCISCKVYSIGTEPEKDTLLYFEFDIRAEKSHPIVMRGVIKKLDYSKLTLSDGEGFISSFYKQGGCFVPNLLSYDDALKECIRINKDSTLLKYLGQGQKLMNLIAGNGRETKLILNSGENVFIRITEVSGLFLRCSGEIQLPSVSNEFLLDDIEEIVDICIPLNITGYNKPTRKCIKKMFK